MALAPGTRVGPYEIIGAIGAGGMGEVYRARDTKLHRDVAIKILPDLFAADPDRLLRFTREAQTLASLNHQNVAHVYGVEDRALVMELVEGEDLAQRLARGPMPVDEAVQIAVQIACGLEAAHERGIVHRDLKPANVRVTPDGTVKVLDFGLAKAASAEGPSFDTSNNSPTFTSPAMMRQGYGDASAPGTIVGTAAYMAPEQARGKAVDKRADIWAFGCVVFEMLTAMRPFGGETVTDMLAAIVKDEADWKALPPNTPPSLRRIITSCLVKDPKQRLRDIGDARIALERIAAGVADDAAPIVVPAPRQRPRASRIATLALAAIAIGAGSALAAWWLGRPAPAPPLPVAHFATPLSLDALPVRSNGSGIALSPDGTSVVYAAQPALLTASVLYRRKLSSLDVEKIPGTDGGYAPFFSPDGKWIGFFTDTSVMRLAVEGGSLSKICNRGRFSRAAWAPDDTIVLGTSVAYAPGALGKVPASGGEPVPLTTLTGKETLHQLPQILPDGRHVAFSVVSPDGYQLAIAPVTGGPHTLLGIEGSGTVFVAPNHLLFARGDAIFSVGFDPRTNQWSGTPAQVLENAAIFATNAVVLFPLVSADRNGSVAYLNKGGTMTQLRWLSSTAPVIPVEEAAYGSMSLSPDGRRAVVTVGLTPPDVWTIDLERGRRLRLTTGGATSPAWSADGSRIAYWHPVSGLMTVASDGSGTPEVFLARPENTVLSPTAWTRDGQAIIVTAEDRGAGRGTRNRDILLVRAGQKPVPLVVTPSDERGAVVSADGRWLAYASSVTGREEIYVRALEGGATVPVSTDGGTYPRWRADSVGFMSTSGIMRAPVTFNPLRIGTPTLAARVPPNSLGGADVTADGRILTIQQRSDAPTRDVIHILLNWGGSLR